MPLRFTRRLSLIPGLRVNLSKRGASLSLGHRGARWTVGPRRQRATRGLPGTGLFWTERIPPGGAVHGGHRLAFVVGGGGARLAGLVVDLIASIKQSEMASIFDEWRPGDLVIEALRVIGLVALAAGVLLAFFGVLGGTPEPLDEPLDPGLIREGVEYAIAGAALWAASRWLRRRLRRG
jgi:hypothetical protein